MQLMAQNQVNNPNKELPPGWQQLLYNQTQIVQMIYQTMNANDNNQLEINYDNQEIQEEMVKIPRVCKTCGEIGHTSKECQDEWPHLDATSSAEEYYTTQVTCFCVKETYMFQLSVNSTL